MNKYFYDVDNKIFLVEGLHDIPPSAIKIEENEFYKLVNARSEGAELYVEKNKVKSTPARPSKYHVWNGKKWVISVDQKNTILTEKATALLQELAAKSAKLKAEFLTGYSIREEQEARGNAPLMLLEELFSSGDYESMDELKKAILDKVDTLAIIEGALIAAETKFKKRIEEATTTEQLEAIKTEIEQWR